MTRLHANCVVIDDTAVLLRGSSGSGKSDLALRLIDEGATLLGDDYVELSINGGHVVAKPPETIRGLIEVRGLGIFRLAYCEEAVLRLVVDLTDPLNVPRLPKSFVRELEGFEGVQIRHIRISPFEASTTAKIRLALTTPADDILDYERVE